MLGEIARLLNSRVDIESAFDEVLRLVTELLGLRTAWLFLQGRTGRRLVFAAAHGLPPALQVERMRPLRQGTCDCFYLFYGGRLREAVNVVECSRLQEASGDRGGLVYHASVPLRASSGVLGVLNVAAEGESLFDEAALSLLTAVGEHLGTALERSRLFSEQRRRGAAFESVDRVVRGLAEPGPGVGTPVEVVARRFARACLAHLAVDRVWVALGEGQDLRLAAVEARPGERLPAAAARPGELVSPRGLLGACWRTGRPHFGQRAARGARPEAVWAVLPVALGRQGLGCVMLERAGSELWGPGERDALRALADHLALAVANARLMERARELARVEERHRLSRDLHDTVSQNLFSLTMLLAASRQHLEAGQAEEARLALEEAQERARATLADMRRLVREMRPSGRPGPALHTVGDLAAALESLSRSDPLARRMGVAVLWEPGRLDPDAPVDAGRADALLRVAQEALHNALRHARARTVRVSLRATGRRLSLVVADDGQGFHVRRARGEGGGLAIMAERCRLAGGGLRIRSRIGTGTRVEAWIPLGGASQGGTEGEPGRGAPP
ncbi:MAG TPA: GAF domain-containing sensor histidine kinase [Limnochordales bacterium]